jgi:hypothetical protein
MKIFGRGLVGAIGAGLVSVLAGPAAATPIQVGIGSFSGSATVIDFQSIANGASITNQYAGSGITFSGGLWGNSNPSTAGLIPGSMGKVATNFVFNCGGGSACGSTLTIDLASTALRVGFDAATNDADNLLINVDAFREGVLVSTFTVDTSLSGQFFGFEDSTLGIDRLMLTPTNSVGGALVLDNVRFEGTIAAVVPEPSAALLFPVGLLVAASLIRRPRQLA